MTVDFQDWNPHPHMAQAQYTQGIPVARKPTAVGGGSNSIPPGATAPIITTQGIDQPSFQAVIFLQYGPGAPVLPFVRADLTWTDSASGLPVQCDSLVLPVGQASASEFLITGPSRMDELTLTFHNLDTALAVSYTAGFSQTSHVYDKLRLCEVNSVVIPTFTRGSAQPQIGSLCSSGANVPAGTHIDRLACAWSGLAQIAVDNTFNANAITAMLVDPGQSVAGTSMYGIAGTGVMASFELPAGSTLVEQVVLPYGPVVLRLSNSAGVAFAPGAVLMRLDQ